ncbi:MAG: hypothetical protein HYV16_12150 [Gammaproteobacteria bacterium]|nr:hypothetical protein [Gammaproteobacteria bacterium]
MSQKLRYAAGLIVHVAESQASATDYANTHAGQDLHSVSFPLGQVAVCRLIGKPTEFKAQAEAKCRELNANDPARYYTTVPVMAMEAAA